MWEVTVPAPAGWISSNQRIHRMEQAKLTKAWRLAGFAAARNAGVPTLDRAAITAYVWKPRNGRYDPGNLYPTCKAVVDGFVDAGVLADDDWKHLDGPDMRHGGKGENALILRISAQENA